MKLLKQIEWYFFPLRKPDLEVEALLKEVEDAKLLPKDISEPVISFVSTVRNDRKRFIVDHHYWDERETYSITDKLTVTTFEVILIVENYRVRSEPIEKARVVKKPEFITNDEVLYVVNSLREFYITLSDRKAVRRDTLLERFRRDKDKRIKEERDRLKSIYCKEVKGE